MPPTCSTPSGKSPATSRSALIVNTHAHPDHTGGNLKIAQAGSQLVAGNFAQQLGQEGARSAFIVAHENVLKAMSAPTGATASLPFGAWPTDTFFQEEKDLYFNGKASSSCTSRRPIPTATSLCSSGART